jgi:hypothetical protein
MNEKEEIDALIFYLPARVSPFLLRRLERESENGRLLLFDDTANELNDWLISRTRTCST